MMLLAEAGRLQRRGGRGHLQTVTNSTNAPSSRFECGRRQLQTALDGRLNSLTCE